MKRKKYTMIIGTWQPITEQDRYEIESKISDGHNILIGIQDIEPTDSKPLTAKQVEIDIKKIFWKYLSDEKIKTLIIPEIE